MQEINTELFAIFKQFFEDANIKKVWHNYSFDRHVLRNHGIDCQGFAADTMHMARLWDSSRQGKGYSLESLTGYAMYLVCSPVILVSQASDSSVYQRKVGRSPNPRAPSHVHSAFLMLPKSCPGAKFEQNVASRAASLSFGMMLCRVGLFCLHITAKSRPFQIPPAASRCTGCCCDARWRRRAFSPSS